LISNPSLSDDLDFDCKSHCRGFSPSLLTSIKYACEVLEFYHECFNAVCWVTERDAACKKFCFNNIVESALLGNSTLPGASTVKIGR